MFDLWLQARQPRGGIKHRNGLQALPKKHTSGQRVRLFYLIRRRRIGGLCLAPIGRLACMTTRSSRSCCSVLRSIRQSNNANESCTNDLWGIAPGRSGKSCQRAGTNFRPARQQLIYRMFSLHGKRSLHIFCDNSATVGSLPFGVNLSTIPGRTCDSCLVISSSERPDF
jgi:hypothetical protein